MSQTQPDRAETTTSACAEDSCCCASVKSAATPASAMQPSEEERRRKILESFGYKRRAAGEEPTGDESAGEQGACGKTRRKTCC